MLAGGALSGTTQRHAIAMPQVAPIASGADYTADVERARRLQPVVDKGYADDLMEASVRFSLASDAMSTVLVGYSTFEHLERAIAVVEKGPLPAPALDLLNGLWAWTRAGSAPVSRAVLAALLVLLLAPSVEAAVSRVEIARREPFAGGHAFEGAGAYEKVVGRFHGELDPAHPMNRGIVDLDLAPRNARGRVEYTADFYL